MWDGSFLMFKRGGTDMENQMVQIAERIKGMRLILDLSVEEMAKVTDTTVEEYIAAENGERDFSFTFLYKCAKMFGLDIAELLTGEAPRLSRYSIVRKGHGLPLERRKGFKYQHLAGLFKDKVSEPFYVTAKYDPEQDCDNIELSTHVGEEFDYILKGTLIFRYEDHIEVLHEGDAVYYDSGRGHGMIAGDGADCDFLAVTMEKKED